ncbi:hypothetical protein [Sphingobium fuliginis]|uniref:hypothetical protein n=1 Tax=Sphingobium fuliginis (strain ATCC 27551) TaxID=336203 RepID=UPI000410DB69|nr:hypothetical protein [Sphingobium fuliginis]
MRTNSAIIHRALCNSSALTACLASLSLIAPAAAQSSTAQQSDTQTAPGQARPHANSAGTDARATRSS